MSDQDRRTNFRLALQASLAKGFKAAELPIAFQGGIINGPQSDRDIGCVWMEQKVASSRDGNNEECTFYVRVLRHFKLDQGGAEPRGEVNDELERTFGLLEDILVANLTRPWLEATSGMDLSSAEMAWFEYFNVTPMSIDHTRQHVQATLRVFARNRTARGG